MRAAFHHSEVVAKNIRTFWFEPETPVDYVAGQFIEMHLPHEPSDVRGQKHWFTLSSSPSEQLISVTTKQATDRMSSFKQQLFGLQAGSVVIISEPMGDFVLPKDKTIPLVFVASGIGITPMRSMVKWLLDSGQKRHIHIIYGVRSLQDAVFTSIFEDYQARVTLVVSEPPGSWQGETGRLSGTRIMELAGTNQAQLIYVSGPEPMTERIEAKLLAIGVAAEKLVLDFFPGYREI